MDLEGRMALFEKTDLYVVITEAFCVGRSALEVLDAVLEAGVRLVQLREKDLDRDALHKQAAAFRERTQQAGALLIINDSVEVALAVGADGVHLGQTDMALEAARAHGPELIIGGSTHSLDQAIAAERAGASYVNIGPIFATQTKSVPTGALGPKALDDIAPHINVPFTCMGGIKLDNIAQVVERGARHPAVVTAVTAADDVQEAARALRNAILCA